MYLQITNRCNMTCEHCCMSSSPRAHKKSEDMSSWIFSQAVELAYNYGDDVTIGGGEPLLHDNFFNFLDKVIEMDFISGGCGIHPLVVTNGKRKAQTWKLIDKYLDMDAPIAVDLSTDIYHDPIDDGIRQYFERYQKNRRNNYQHRAYNSAVIGTRNTESFIIKIGRGINIPGAKEGCCCETPLVDVVGDVFSCGCKHTKIGNVVTDTSFYDWYDREFAHTGGINLKEENE